MRKIKNQDFFQSRFQMAQKGPKNLTFLSEKIDFLSGVQIMVWITNIQQPAGFPVYEYQYS